MKVAFVTLVAVLASAGVAAASNGKTRVQVDRFADSYLFAVDCGGFQDVASGKEHVDVTEVYSTEDGTLQDQRLAIWRLGELGAGDNRFVS